MATNEQQSKSIKDAIRKVLNTDWDPIDVMSDPEWPSDEYDNYIDGIHELLARGESAEAIAQHLAHIEEDFMGTASNMSDLRQIAEKLKTINISDQS